VISGKVEIGKYVHITPMCLIAGGEPGVYLSDFCTLAYGVKIFAQSDDYSGETMVNSLIDSRFKSETFGKVFLLKHVVIGTNSVVLPGVTIAEGCSAGAMSLFNKSTYGWGIYVGSPAKRIKERKKTLLELEKKFLERGSNDKL
jgi:galactoside O-acetyltransferase